MGRQTSEQRRHDRAPTDAQRDERVRLDVDPDEALRRLMGIEPGESDDSGSEGDEA